MKKFINKYEDMIDEMLTGFSAANCDKEVIKEFPDIKGEQIAACPDCASDISEFD